MATPYLDRTSLAAHLGSKIVDRSAEQLGANLDDVISAACARADGYVRKQIVLPPTPEAIEQIAPIVAELVYVALNMNNKDPEVAKRRDSAERALRDIATGMAVLHTLPIADNPATPEDESDEAGPACGSERRRMTSKRTWYEDFDA